MNRLSAAAWISALFMAAVLFSNTVALRLFLLLLCVGFALAAACGIAVIGVVAGMLMRNMTDTLWVRHNALLYWAVLGVLFAWGCRTRVER
jgi:hypothetical protein